MKFKKHRFDRVVITKGGGIIFLPPVITRRKNHYEVDQWMGAFKTGAAMEHIGRVHKNGGRILTNFKVGYLSHNIGKPKEKWTPNILGLDDLEKANNCTMVLDDIKKILERWNCAEAVLVSKVVNASRKERVDIIITSQRTVNSVPTDIREVCTNYEIPFVTVRDQRINSPDGMGTPLEVEIFNISATGNFLGFGIWNGFYPDGCTLKPTKKMLDMYDTTEKVTDLKTEGARPNQPGYALEEKAFEYLKEKVPGMQWEHLNGKHVFDIISDTHAIDVVGTDPDGCLVLEHKDLSKHMRTAKRKGQLPYLMFLYSGGWRFFKITPNLSALVEGMRIKPDTIANNRFKSIEKLMN